MLPGIDVGRVRLWTIITLFTGAAKDWARKWAFHNVNISFLVLSTHLQFSQDLTCAFKIIQTTVIVKIYWQYKIEFEVEDNTNDETACYKCM